MATQRSIVYTDSSMQLQCAIVDPGQIIYIDPAQTIPPELSPRHTQIVVQPARLSCRLQLGPCWKIDGWVYLKSPIKSQVDSCGKHLVLGREFNTLFIKEHEELYRYYKVHRNTAIGKHFEVMKCDQGRSKHELSALGRRTAHMFVDTTHGPCCCCDFTLQKDDVVQVIGASRADPGSCRCGGAGLCSRGGHCGGQNRLEVVGHLNGNSIGWISEEKEYILSDEVRMVLHKSKLNIAQVWALAHAEAEHFRRAEKLFKGIKKFEEITAVERTKSTSTLSHRLN